MAAFETGITRELRFFPGSSAESLFITGDAAETLERLCETRSGSVSLVYMDPPFMTGQRFNVRVKVGEEDWSTCRGSLTLPAYDDRMPRDRFLAMLRRVFTACRALLTDDGLIFVHIDWRLSAHVRLLLDEVFGEKNFVNEIIWTYESGGRAKNFFSRKHDVILAFAKTPAYDLHPADVAVTRASKNTDNHMKRDIDEDGRSYRTIKSGGKIYKYYDDDPVPPSDVWDDISHMQQKDPQRTGYETQKPLALLERIVNSASRKGDTVLDPFCGSGTTLEAACKNGRNFIGIDSNPICAQYARRRTEGTGSVFEVRPAAGSPEVQTQVVSALGTYRVLLERFLLEEGLPRTQGLDAVDSWSAGTYEDGVYTALARETRSWKNPGLAGQLDIPLTGAPLMARISDITGRDFYIKLQ